MKQNQKTPFIKIMKAKNVFNLVLISCILFIISCNHQNQIKTNMALQIVSDTVTNTIIDQNGKKDYELAAEFIEKLKKGNADTILYHKRTCINCCDFFNIFWSEKGKKYLAKFYFEDMKTHSKVIDLKNDKIFDVLNKNFHKLKNSTIKDNVHKVDGETSFSIVDHYCYTQLDIYTKHDSIITDRIKDYDFDKYTDFDSSNSNGETNDNYIENNNSKLNLLLITIENEIDQMPEIVHREKGILRKNKNKE